MREARVQFLDREDPLEKEPTPVFMPGKSHGPRRWATVHEVTESRTRLSDFTFNKEGVPSP